MSRSRADIVAVAGRLFAERGYHGTSMRDLARELDLRGSSLYSHISSKEDLLVEVVETGAALFGRSATDALAASEDPVDQLRALVAGHVDVVLDHLDTVRTFLNEARALDEDHRARVIDVRDRYEAVFRDVIGRGVTAGAFRADADPKVASIFVLSILNAIDRWYSDEGRLSRPELVDELMGFISHALEGP